MSFDVKVKITIDPTGKIINVTDGGTDPMQNVTARANPALVGMLPVIWAYLQEEAGIYNDANWAGKATNDLYGFRLTRPQASDIPDLTGMQKMLAGSIIDFTCGAVETAVLKGMQTL